MIYADCQFTMSELALIEEALIDWRVAHCSETEEEMGQSQHAAINFARDVSWRLVDRCITYREELVRRQELSKRASASGNPF